MTQCINPIISAENLSCLSGSNYLLHDINWNINRGDQWVVFGRNGCGKTTLLSIIAGYKGFSGGKLRVFGEEYSAENISIIFIFKVFIYFIFIWPCLVA